MFGRGRNSVPVIGAVFRSYAAAAYLFLTLVIHKSGLGHMKIFTNCLLVLLLFFGLVLQSLRTV